MYDSIFGTAAARRTHNGEAPRLSLAEVGALSARLLNRPEAETSEFVAAFNVWEAARDSAAEAARRSLLFNADGTETTPEQERAIREERARLAAEAVRAELVLRFAAEELWISGESVDGDL